MQLSEEATLQNVATGGKKKNANAPINISYAFWFFLKDEKQLRMNLLLLFLFFFAFFHSTASRLTEEELVTFSFFIFHILPSCCFHNHCSRRENGRGCRQSRECDEVDYVSCRSHSPNKGK